MTKTIYSLTPAKSGDYADAILQMIANHNSGTRTINLKNITGWIICEYARWQIIKKEPKFKVDSANGILEVYEADVLAFTINEKIIEVLDTPETTDKAQGEA